MINLPFVFSFYISFRIPVLFSFFLHKWVLIFLANLLKGHLSNQQFYRLGQFLHQDELVLLLIPEQRTWCHKVFAKGLSFLIRFEQWIL